MLPALVTPLLPWREGQEEGVGPMLPALMTPLLPQWECLGE